MGDSKVRRPSDDGSKAGASKAGEATTADSGTPGARSTRPKGFDLMVMLAIGFAIAELAVRLLGLEPTTYPPHRMLETADKRRGLECYPEVVAGGLDVVDLRDSVIYSQAVEHGFTGAQLDGALENHTPHCVLFSYNAHTRRDTELRVDARVPSVMVIGDSFTEGAGVPEDEVFPRRLERRLQDALGRTPQEPWQLAVMEPRAIRVWNAGRRGADQPQIRDDLSRFLPLVEPDVVVYAFVLNDFEMSEEHRARQQYLNDLVMDRQRTGTPDWKLPRWLGWSALVRAFTARGRLAEETRRTVDWYLGMTGPENADGWARTQDDLRAMRDAVEARGDRRFLVAILPLLVGDEGGYPFDPVHEALLRFCDEASLRCVDLREALGRTDPRRLHVHPVDMHPNAIAHARIAEALEAHVLALLDEVTAPDEEVDDAALDERRERIEAREHRREATPGEPSE
ncbi:MAG: SGNH/GDSL hydrolase family protein [Myxococcota bacterium]|jgi:lysophospholipase L1-like esterase|nr:SGNH/GDSL hydrolase family protein [Myxococcota bacterium]